MDKPEPLAMLGMQGTGRRRKHREKNNKVHRNNENWKHKVLKVSLCYEFAWFSVRQTLKWNRGSCITIVHVFIVLTKGCSYFQLSLLRCTLLFFSLCFRLRSVPCIPSKLPLFHLSTEASASHPMHPHTNTNTIYYKVTALSVHCFAYHCLWVALRVSAIQTPS
jgi:hypothetical protein